MVSKAIQTRSRQLVFKMMVVAIVAALLGAVAGVDNANAEWSYNLYVHGVGNVGNAGTLGWSASSSDHYATGYSTASQTLYEIRSHIRFWHHRPPGDGGNQIQFQHDTGYRYWTNVAITDEIYASGYGDIATTRSYFHYAQWSNTDTYHTSYPNNTGSCYNHWEYGNYC